jgi:hypothetical protein
VRWRESLWVPANWKAEVDADQLPFLVELEIAATPGLLEITTYKAVRRPGGAPITARQFRRLPVDSLCEAAGIAIALEGDVSDGIVTLRPSLRDFVTLRPPQALHARGRAPLGDEHFKQVASIYRSARRSGQPAARAVADDSRWGRVVPLKTAERWIRAARDGGFLKGDE